MNMSQPYFVGVDIKGNYFDVENKS